MIRRGRLTPTQLGDLYRYTKKWIHYAGFGKCIIIWSGKDIVEAEPFQMPWDDGKPKPKPVKCANCRHQIRKDGITWLHADTGERTCVPVNRAEPEPQEN